MASYSFNAGSLEWLSKTLRYITRPMLCTTSVVRLPQAKKFVTVLPDTHFKITDAVVQFKKESSLILNGQLEALLLESAQVSMPVVVENTAKAPRIVSVSPGASKHYLKKLTLKSNKSLLTMFWPLDGDFFNREFLIEELSFPAKDFAFRDKFGEKDEKITVKTVLVKSENATVRIFLQTESGTAFMLIANKLDDLAPEAALKGIYELNPEMKELYIKQFVQSKNEIEKIS